MTDRPTDRPTDTARVALGKVTSPIIILIMLLSFSMKHIIWMRSHISKEICQPFKSQEKKLIR